MQIELRTVFLYACQYMKYLFDHVFLKGLMVYGGSDMLILKKPQVGNAGGLSFSFLLLSLLFYFYFFWSLHSVFVPRLCCSDESRLKHMLMDAH